MATGAGAAVRGSGSRRAFCSGLAVAVLVAGAAGPAGSQTVLQPGEAPPPVYETRLPPAVTLSYEVRYKFLRGAGEIRWQPAGDTYALSLDASYAGLTLIEQTSRGQIGAAGLMPLRFVDRRIRRSPEAADFHRADSTIAFSGSPVSLPLLAGTQDRLSWMIQLAGIAAAAPKRVAKGARVSMVVVGSRGEADVWLLRSMGAQEVETRAGRVRAVKLVREARTSGDSSAEIWLDPARDHLPVKATYGNAAGETEFVLSLQGVEPGR